MVQKDSVPVVPEREGAHFDSQVRVEIGRDMARAMADAGYMPLQRYVELYGPPPLRSVS